MEPTEYDRIADLLIQIRKKVDNLNPTRHNAILWKESMLEAIASALESNDALGEYDAKGWLWWRVIANAMCIRAQFVGELMACIMDQICAWARNTIRGVAGGVKNESSLPIIRPNSCYFGDFAGVATGKNQRTTGTNPVQKPVACGSCTNAPEQQVRNC